RRQARHRFAEGIAKRRAVESLQVFELGIGYAGGDLIELVIVAAIEAPLAIAFAQPDPRRAHAQPRRERRAAVVCRDARAARFLDEHAFAKHLEQLGAVSE